jgi:LPS-assembly protein
VFLFLLLVSKTTLAEGKFLFADKVEYNEEEKFAEAIGHVRIVMDKYIVHADKVFYDMEKDEVWGYGNVRAFNGSEQIAIGEAVLLTEKAKHIIISSFILYFKTSDTVITAALAKRYTNGNSYLKKAIFTSCPTCKGSKPLWQISAEKAHVLQDKHRVVYKNMFFQIYGVPVAFFPFFAHQLPGAPPKSGILMPNIKGKKLGISLYFRPKNSLDATITPRISKKGMIHEAELRHLLKSGSYRFTGSMTANKKNVSIVKKGKTISQKKIHRYNFSGKGDFINSDIHYGFDINRVSDLGFLKEYYQRHDPFLKSNIYGYKVDRENYLEVNSLYLQGLGANDRAGTDPHVIPEINFRYIIPIPQTGDGKLKIDNYTSVYATDRLGKVTRTIWEMSFYNSHTTDTGQVLGLELYDRSDLYLVDLEGFHKKQYTVGRSIPELRLSGRYPWVGKLGESSLVVEPITLLVFGRKHIPDSKKFHFIDTDNYDYDDSNFLKYNRYSGYDFHEYGNRITYGANSYLDIKNRYRVGMFLGQYQKLSHSALNKPDIVGKASMNFQEQLELYYRFRKKPKNFRSVFDELGVLYNGDNISFNGGFINLQDVHLENTRKIKQVYFDSGYQYDDYWYKSDIYGRLC